MPNTISIRLATTAADDTRAVAHDRVLPAVPHVFSVDATPIYSLYDLFVVPGHRKTGTGRLLLQAAYEQARCAGKSRMDLTTAKSNLPAQALYAAMGWKRDEVFYAYSKHIAA